MVGLFTFICSPRAQEPSKAPSEAAPPAAALPSPATLRFLAIDHKGNPVIDLRVEEISVRVANQTRKVASLSPARTEPRTIGFFFDNSGSRRSDKLIGAEVAAASKFLQSNWRPRDVGFVILFDDQPFTLAKPTSDVASILAALQKIPFQRRVGSTALYDALCSVSIAGPQTGRGEELYIVVGDFEDNSSRRSEQKMIEVIREENVRIFPLLRLDEDNPRIQNARRAEKIAKEVAEKTGGEVLRVSAEKDLEIAFLHLSSGLQGAYRLTFEPLPEESKSKPPQIQTTRQNVDLIFPKN
jgi:VWFA-related protein